MYHSMIKFDAIAQVVKLVDTRDLKSLEGNFVPVQVRIDIIYPVHLNPNVKDIVFKNLSNQPNIHLLQPLEYLEFVYLMERSYLILTDSGGIQEEAPSLGKPVLVMRDTSERPEAISAGTVKLVGTKQKEIVKQTQDLISNEKKYFEMSTAHNPYGDGKSADLICSALEELIV